MTGKLETCSGLPGKGIPFIMEIPGELNEEFKFHDPELSIINGKWKSDGLGAKKDEKKLEWKIVNCRLSLLHNNTLEK